MKRLFIIVVLSLAVQLEAKSQQRRIDNRTNCDIRVTQYCVDLCSLGNTYNYNVPANQSRQITNDCISHPVVSEYFEVCWVVPNEQCDGDPPIPCAMVDGENAQGCGPNTYTDVIQYCDACVPSSGGVATVTYFPGTTPWALVIQ